MVELPDPPVPTDADLRDFQFMPIDIVRLFGSTFHARATDAEWRAGVTLWLKSYHQVPAGSLPDDDIELCRLAELGRDIKMWRKIKSMAMHGWSAANDGRLYHSVVAEKAAEAWYRKGEQKIRTLKARVAALEKRLSEAASDNDKRHLDSLLKPLRQTLLQTLDQPVTDRSKKPVTASNRQRQGQGQGYEQGEGQGQGDYNSSGPGGPAPKAAREGSKPQDALFQIWLPWLMERTGRPRQGCAGQIGKWRKAFANNDLALLAAFERCKADGTVDPMGWMEGAARSHKSREPGEQTTQEGLAEIEASGVYDGAIL